jgi:hypothetical protein
VSPMAIGWIVFALVFGSALLAMFVHTALPEHHLSSDSKDVVKLGIALVATMSALVLGLLIASAKSAYDTRSNQLAEASADIILLDRALARYGPETKEARSLLQRFVAATVERLWPAEGAKPIAIDPGAVEDGSTTTRLCGCAGGSNSSTRSGDARAGVIPSRTSTTRSRRCRRRATRSARCGVRP